MVANAPERVLAIYDVLQSKMFRRGVPLKSLDVGDGEPKPSGEGISTGWNAEERAESGET